MNAANIFTAFLVIMILPFITACPGSFSANKVESKQVEVQGDEHGTEYVDVDTDKDGVVDDHDCAPNDDQSWRIEEYSYIDEDRDNYTIPLDAPMEFCIGNTSAPEEFKKTSNGNDCDDSEITIYKNNTYSHIDADTDGVTLELDDPIKVCEGDIITHNYKKVANGEDCDDSEITIFEYNTYPYIDADTDGVTLELDDPIKVCEGDIITHNYKKVANGEDCDDSEITLFESNTYPYIDADTDGRTFEMFSPVTLCEGDIKTHRYKKIANGADCDDSEITIYKYSTYSYIDADTDGVTLELDDPIRVCEGDVITHNYKKIANGEDCDDLEITLFESNTYAYIDADTDGRTFEMFSPVTLCEGDIKTHRYKKIANGADCDDSKITLFESNTYPYIDADTDGRTFEMDNPVTLCEGDIKTHRYKKIANGADCDDSKITLFESNTYPYIDADADGITFEMHQPVTLCEGDIKTHKYKKIANGDDCDETDNILFKHFSWLSPFDTGLSQYEYCSGYLNGSLVKSVVLPNIKKSDYTVSFGRPQIEGASDVTTNAIALRDHKDTNSPNKISVSLGANGLLNLPISQNEDHYVFGVDVQINNLAHEFAIHLDVPSPRSLTFDRFGKVFASGASSDTEGSTLSYSMNEIISVRYFLNNRSNKLSCYINEKLLAKYTFRTSNDESSDASGELHMRFSLGNHGGASTGASSVIVDNIMAARSSDSVQKTITDFAFSSNLVTIFDYSSNPISIANFHDLTAQKGSVLIIDRFENESAYEQVKFSISDLLNEGSNFTFDGEYIFGIDLLIAQQNSRVTVCFDTPLYSSISFENGIVSTSSGALAGSSSLTYNLGEKIRVQIYVNSEKNLTDIYINGVYLASHTFRKFSAAKNKVVEGEVQMRLHVGDFNTSHTGPTRVIADNAVFLKIK